jgi:hypothetical protein
MRTSNQILFGFFSFAAVFFIGLIFDLQFWQAGIHFEERHPPEARMDRASSRGRGTAEDPHSARYRFQRCAFGDVDRHLAGPIFLLDVSEETLAAQITLRLTNVPASEALRYIASLAQCRYQVTGREVRIFPLETPAE